MFNILHGRSGSDFAKYRKAGNNFYLSTNGINNIDDRTKPSFGDFRARGAILKSDPHFRFWIITDVRNADNPLKNRIHK